MKRIRGLAEGAQAPPERPSGSGQESADAGAREASRASPGRPRPLIRSFREFCGLVGEDLRVNQSVWRPGFQAVATHRLGAWSNGIRSRVLRAVVWRVYRFLHSIVRNVYGIEIANKTRIGRRLTILHQHGIALHPSATLGDDCVLRQGVTIGETGVRRGNIRAPQLGNRVKVGAGAILLGPITVGDDVKVGPNAVVLTDVPAGSIVASPQSRIMTPPKGGFAGTPPEDSAAVRQQREDDPT